MQRAVIVLRAKDVEFDVTYINLREKPDWFLEISPHGKVPVLKVDDDVLFESNAIAEYLDEAVEPTLHPKDPIKRARNRAWTDFVPDFSRQLGMVTYARSTEALAEAMDKVPKALSRLEDAIQNERENEGPFFNGDVLSLVDASYAPFLQRFSIAEKYLQSGLLNEFPNLQKWADALVSNTSVQNSVAPEFFDVFEDALKLRGTLAAENRDAR
ncbi:MAG: glutathione S-transferase [Gammaproteobacteria bacterium]|nr:glutathione S-transferase [Gammaproteobacteria bacterium]